MTDTSSTVSSTVSSLGTTAATSQLNSDGSKSAAAAVSMDSDQWLTLLTTELKNQDPTAPSDPTQFVAQLAQFSAVSQQVATNTTLTGIASQLSAGAMGQSASMIGKTVQGAADTYVVPNSGAGPSVGYGFSVTSSTLKNIHLQVTNAAGNVVGQASVQGGSGTVQFNGTSTTGGALGAGSYTVALVGTNDSGATETAGTLTTSGVVSAVLQNGDKTELQLNNGATVGASGITQLSTS